MAIKQQKERRQNKAYRHNDIFCEGISRRWEYHHKVVKSEDNEADILTKNTSNIIYQRHQEKLVWDKKEVIKVKSPSKETKYETTGRMLKSK